MPAWPLAIALPDENATKALAARIAPLLRIGDVVTLRGEIGAGKTTLARALIRTLAANPDLEVPSPTFTLVQPYDETRVPVAHYDLYRLADASELDELGFEDAVAVGIALVEWPERAAGRFPEALGVELRESGGGRSATLSGGAAWAARAAGLGT